MAGEGGDEVRVLDQLVDVADEGAAGHVALAISLIGTLTSVLVTVSSLVTR